MTESSESQPRRPKRLGTAAAITLSAALAGGAALYGVAALKNQEQVEQIEHNQDSYALMLRSLVDSYINQKSSSAFWESLRTQIDTNGAEGTKGRLFAGDQGVIEMIYFADKNKDGSNIPSLVFNSYTSYNPGSPPRDHLELLVHLDSNGEVSDGKPTANLSTEKLQERASEIFLIPDGLRQATWSSPDQTWGYSSKVFQDGNGTNFSLASTPSANMVSLSVDFPPK